MPKNFDQKHECHIYNRIHIMSVDTWHYILTWDLAQPSHVGSV